MNSGASVDPGELLGVARAGSAAALGQLLELYRGYLALLGANADRTTVEGQG